MKKLFTLLTLSLFIHGFSQTVTAPIPESAGTTPDWTADYNKAGVDVCGAYFNNYPGRIKTSLIFFEGMATGDGTDFTPYAGRGQRYHAPQPIEVTGLQFYSFQTNPDIDSLMVVTLLFDWDEAVDSIGTELARDTVWVKHTAFTPLLTELEVNSVFDEPIVVEEDYIVALYTPTNDSLKIITNDASGDGAMEGLSFAYYENPVAPSYTGWYHTLETFGPAYDIDYLISPLVSYELHNGFTLSDSTICPSIVSSTCAEYIQMPVFSDPHYNRFYDAPTEKVNWTWGDGLQNNELTSLCHTYAESGIYSITLIDSISRHTTLHNTCTVEISKNLFALDSIDLSAIGESAGLTATFSGEAIGADSVSWNFGDENTSTELNPIHIYEEIGTYDVWFYAYGACNADSVMISITIDDVGINEQELHVRIFPNPTNTELNIVSQHINTQVEIISTTGAIVFSSAINAETHRINTTNFANGIYILNIYSDHQKKTQKLVVKH